MSVPTAAVPSEEAGFAALYERHYREACRMAYLLTGDRDLAEDLTQEAFVRILPRLERLTEPAAFGAYVRRTIVNLTRSRHRSLERERRRAERVARFPAPDREEVGRVDPTLWRAVQRLAERQRAAIVLRYWLDLSEADAAAALGCPTGTVKSLVARGLASLREEVGHDEA